MFQSETNTNIADMKKSYEAEFKDVKESVRQYLPDDIMNRLENVVNNGKNFDSNLWIDIVYNYAAAYKRVNNESGKYQLLDTLKTLWIGRFVSYATEVQDMDINAAEKVIQKQSDLFEEKFEYLKTIYENNIPAQ